MPSFPRVGILGGSDGGVLLALSFVKGGVHVGLYDDDPSAIRGAMESIHDRLRTSGDPAALTRIEPLDRIEQLGCADAVFDLSKARPERLEALSKAVEDGLPIASRAAGEGGRALGACKDPDRIFVLSEKGPVSRENARREAFETVSRLWTLRR